MCADERSSCRETVVRVLAANSAADAVACVVERTEISSGEVFVNTLKERCDVRERGVG